MQGMKFPASSGSCLWEDTSLLHLPVQAESLGPSGEGCLWVDFSQWGELHEGRLAPCARFTWWVSWWNKTESPRSTAQRVVSDMQRVVSYIIHLCCKLVYMIYIYIHDLIWDTTYMWYMIHIRCSPRSLYSAWDIASGKAYSHVANGLMTFQALQDVKFVSDIVNGRPIICSEECSLPPHSAADQRVDRGTKAISAAAFSQWCLARPQVLRFEVQIREVDSRCSFGRKTGTVNMTGTTEQP